MTKTWKGVELRIARYLGTERNPLSGGNAKHSRSDSLHLDLFVEAKHGKAAERILRSRIQLIRLFEKTEKMAILEGKIPVVVLHPLSWGGGVANYPAYIRVGRPFVPTSVRMLRIQDMTIVQVPLSAVKVAAEMIGVVP